MNLINILIYLLSFVLFCSPVPYPVPLRLYPYARTLFAFTKFIQVTGFA